MTKRTWASGSKLGRLAVDIILCFGKKRAQRDVLVAHYAEVYNVHPRTVERVLDGETWVNAVGKTLPQEHKFCMVCGKRYERTWPNGRRRSQKFWDQKRTCSNSCCVRLAWHEGQYAHRAQPKAKAAKK
jgi:hypothetical protein